MQAEPVDALVLGAGPAGLAAAAMIGRRGLTAVVLDRGAGPGESWRRRYDSLRLNSVRWMSSLPGYRMDPRWGDFPSRDAWVDYLRRYSDRFGLQIEPCVEVQRVSRAASGEWLVQTSRGERRARTVVVATGMDHSPVIPEWPGRGSFGRTLIHSSEYRSPKGFEGKHVLVVGAGNSATEIAHDLATGGARRVDISVRTPPLILPRRFAGISITAWAIPALPMPDWILDPASHLVQRISFGDLKPYGLPRGERGISAQRREGYVAPVDSGFVAAVKAGAISVVPAVERLEADAVALSSGATVKPDAVIAATGYRTGLEPLLGHLGVLGEDERPRCHGGASPPGAQGLYFTGYHFKLIPTLPHLGTEARGIARSISRTRRP